jgi:hypothetical protein
MFMNTHQKGNFVYWVNGMIEVRRGPATQDLYENR